MPLSTGLCFRGFLDACHEIAKRKFLNGSILQTMEDFIDHCLENLQDDQLFRTRNNSRLLYGRTARPQRYPILEPMVDGIKSPVLVDEQSGVYLDSRLRPGKYSKPSSTDDVDLFLRRHSKLDAIRPKRTKSRSKQKDER